MPRVLLSKLINYTDRQKELRQAVRTHRYILYGGARGGGKSYGLRWLALDLLVNWYQELGVKNARFGIFCEDYPTLKDRQISKVKIEFPEFLGRYNGEDHEFRLEKELGGGVIVFRNLDDPSKYQCYHPDTEILTKAGFRRIGDVAVGDLVGTFDPENRTATYAPVTKAWKYDFDGELVTTPNGKHHVAFAVTPNHRILARTTRGPLKFYYANNLPSEFHVPRLATWVDGISATHFSIPPAFLGRAKKHTRFEMKTWLEFLGWYLAEGSLGSRLRYEIRVSQVKIPQRERIRAVLKRLGYRFHEDDRGFRLNGKALFMYLKQFGGAQQKHIPRGLLSLKPSLLQYLFNGLMGGDGHQYESGRFVYVTISPQLVDDVSELSIRLGLVPTVIPIPPETRQGYPNDKPLWHVSICARQDTRVRETVRQRYKGPVYCITVSPHHTVMIRYKNRVMWCGQSSEFAGIGVDELTKNDESIFDILRGSLRWPGIERTIFVGATNPGGKGHLWVKRLWIDGRFPPNLESKAHEFKYIKALPTDNPHNADSYIEELGTLTEKMRRAWLEGDWTVFEGQVFEEWRNELHIMEEFKVPPTWEYGAGLDFGFRDNGVMAIMATGSENRVVVVDEFVFKELDAEEAGHQAGLKLRAHPLFPWICADEAMFWQTGGPTQAEMFQEGLNRAMGKHAPVLVKITHGKGSRPASLTLFHRYLAWKGVDGKVAEWNQPRLRFHKRCKYLIETIPALPYPKDSLAGQKKDDVCTQSEDHGYDAVRYFLMSRPTFGEPIPGLVERDVHPGFKDGKRKEPEWAKRFQEEEVPMFKMPRETEELKGWL